MFYRASRSKKPILDEKEEITYLIPKNVGFSNLVLKTLHYPSELLAKSTKMIRNKYSTHSAEYQSNGLNNKKK